MPASSRTRPSSLLVTGGSGFIGSAFIRHALAETDWKVVNFDALTYAANPASLSALEGHDRYAFIRGDIAEPDQVAAAVRSCQPDAIVNFAAETHVDRSIDSAAAFVRTNVLGTQILLDAALAHRDRLPPTRSDGFRFLQISTDEVYGSLGAEGRFSETTAYAPNSPYAASKAAADHLVRACHRTHGLPILLTNCSNNYGPWQFPEKLIPLSITKALCGEQIPIYGRGENVRDWLYVDDHVRALRLVLERGRAGETYNIGGGAELTNIDLVNRLCAVLDRLAPKDKGRYGEQITFVADRPGHDLRYAIDAAKIMAELGWLPKETFDSGLERVVRWYLDQSEWWRGLRRDRYAGERLGQAR